MEFVHNPAYMRFLSRITALHEENTEYPEYDEGGKVVLPEELTEFVDKVFNNCKRLGGYVSSRQIAALAYAMFDAHVVSRDVLASMIHDLDKRFSEAVK